ncbi:Formyl-CoA:oxalate CoA-transferase [compost metagenome]
MFDFPQVQAEDMISTFAHPVIGSYRGFAQAIKFGRSQPATPRAAPAFGEHSAEVLAEAGISMERPGP